jgi:hypothetical protein
VALLVGLCALGAVLAFSVVLVVYLRRSADAETSAPAQGPVATTTATAPGAAPGSPAAAPTHITPTPAPHSGPSPAPAPPATPDPRVSIGVAMTNYWDPTELKSLAESHKGELVTCFRATLARDPKFRGTATITVFSTLGPQDCKFEERRDDEAETLCGCTRAAISGWHLPKHKSPYGSALFEYVISFAP